MSKILYEVYKNDIKDSESVMYGKWYARLKSIETMSMTKLAKHISEHGSVFTEDVVEGVMKKFKSCLLEMLLESKKVKVAGLGTFYLTCECEKGGADKEADFNVNQHLKALHIRFLPDQTQEDNLSSREFIKKAEFVNIKTLLSGNTDAEGDEDNEDSSLTPDSSPTGEGSDNQDGSGSQNSGSGSGNSGSQNSGSQSQQSSVAAPVISGTSPFEESTQVSISGPEGASIYYSVNGDDPDTNDTLYSQPFTVDETTTVKAIAILNGESSSVASKTLYKSSSGDDNSGGFEMGS